MVFGVETGREGSREKRMKRLNHGRGRVMFHKTGTTARGLLVLLLAVVEKRKKGS